jgi:SpoVK/Ycf46/Vps4 family AAA+-type ATPase
MFKWAKAFIFFFIIFINYTSNANAIYNRTINQFKNMFNKFFQKDVQKKVKYNLGDISQTIPYKLYLIIEELKNLDDNQNLTNNLFLNRLILYGPPGNGKSTYARKVAQAINASFHEISGPSIVNTYQGSGAENVNKIFDEALAENNITQRKIVIFIDEVDSIASKKAKRLDNKASVQALWLNIDKIKTNPSIFVIIATNEFKNIHPTLIDRFGDNILEIQNPDNQMRKEVIEFFIQKFQLNAEKLEINNLIKKMNGFSIRAIEDALRSIKRIANIENNGEPTEQIINDILKIHKKKSLFGDLKSKIENAQKYLNFINSAGGLLTIVVNTLTLYSYIKANSQKNGLENNALSASGILQQ